MTSRNPLHGNACRREESKPGRDPAPPLLE
jgi:hypothetical protein